MKKQESRQIECKVCLLSYDCENRIPHVLRCGHSFCRACLLQIIRIEKKVDVICPLCRFITPLVLRREGLGLPMNHSLIDEIQSQEIQWSASNDDGVTPAEVPVPLADDRVPNQLQRLPFFRPNPDLPPTLLPFQRNPPQVVPADNRMAMIALGPRAGWMFVREEFLTDSDDINQIIATIQQNQWENVAREYGFPLQQTVNPPFPYKIINDAEYALDRIGVLYNDLAAENRQVSNQAFALPRSTDEPVSPAPENLEESGTHSPSSQSMMNRAQRRRIRESRLEQRRVQHQRNQNPERGIRSSPRIRTLPSGGNNNFSL